jgi:hypothetical protein
VELILAIPFWEATWIERAQSLGLDRNPVRGTWHALHPAWSHLEAFKALMGADAAKKLRRHLIAVDELERQRVRVLEIAKRAADDAGIEAPFGFKADGTPRKRPGSGGRKALSPQEREQRRRQSKAVWQQKNREKAAGYVRICRERSEFASAPALQIRST